ncbi:MAG: hypothetical protein BAJALOKI2v1_730008 [Promethearchaeota archaeon]|nr:MAG: hypothetical protein BAJALOKI2v1_730008 [Candidatus Lokiarchaeota archaeon]
MKSKVAIQRIEKKEIKSAVFNALEIIKAERLFTNENMTILIKPNILMGKDPERAVTTHPEVLRSTIQWIKQFNPKRIIVAESSGTKTIGATEKAFEGSQIKLVCEEEEVEWTPFEKTKRKIYKVKDPLVLEEITTSNLLAEADLIINIPKIKTHSQCLLTCSIKNMFGTLLLGNKPRVHAKYPSLESFNSALADIYSVSNPQLTIVDGFLCQEGNGPTKGDVVELGLILAGFDGVAIDTVVCKIIGFNPNEVIHIEKAKEKGLGTNDLKEIQIVGDEIESVKRKFKKPRIKPVSVPLPKWLADYVGEKIFKATIKFDSSKCIMCKTCIKNCPVDALKAPKLRSKKRIPIWDKSKCISCYCCAELCPEEAVSFKINYIKNALFSWLGVGFLGFIFLIMLLILWII